MGLDSYLEIFATAYGWSIAQTIYRLLVDSGLIFFPLFVTIVAVWMEAHVQGSDNGAVEWSVRKLEVELGVALFVMAVCFIPTPWTTIDRVTLLYTAEATVANPSPPTVNGGNTGTTYDQAFGANAGAIPVPMWWYTVMGLSSGVNAAVRTSLANGFLGMRQAEELAKLATIEDPRLRSEAQNFRNWCFVPAHGRFHDPNTPPSPIINTVIANELYGKDDTEWIGSHGFLQDPAYYASFRSRQPINGFAMDPVDDADAAPGTQGNSMPNCRRWWQGDTADNGLQYRLINQGGTTMKRAGDYVAGLVKAASGLSPTNPGALDPDYVRDEILKQALWRTQANFAQTEQVIGGQNESRWSLPEFLSGLGIAQKGFEATFSYYPVVQFLIMSQPLVLMALYMFTPLIVLFSRFSLQYMLQGGLAIFTVKFWAAMWAIARYVDERLVVAMYGDTTIWVREYVTNGFDGGSKRAILNVLTLGLFFVLPMVWSGMMAWVGFKVGVAVQDALKNANDSGRQAGAATNAIVTPKVIAGIRGVIFRRGK